ncbi:hypothetical protein Pfo_006579 [Paulownia fortunei]|nr:hypothetical protein Pfo_006579 [Paulownia fortunei]
MQVFTLIFQDSCSNSKLLLSVFFSCLGTLLIFLFCFNTEFCMYETEDQELIDCQHDVLNTELQLNKVSGTNGLKKWLRPSFLLDLFTFPCSTRLFLKFGV